MGEIIDLQEKIIERSHHDTGEAKCLACGHTWIAVAPIGVLWLECPKCSGKRGTIIGAHKPLGLHWRCSCGCCLFYITEDGYCCPNCGRVQDAS